MFVLLMVPVLYVVLHMFFMRLPAPEGREIFRANAWGENTDALVLVQIYLFKRALQYPKPLSCKQGESVNPIRCPPRVNYLCRRTRQK